MTRLISCSRRVPNDIGPLMGMRTDQLTNKELLKLKHWYLSQAMLLSDEIQTRFYIENKS